MAVKATLWQRRRAVARAVEARARAVEARVRAVAEVGGGTGRCLEEEARPRVVEATVAAVAVATAAAVAVATRAREMVGLEMAEAALGAAAWAEVVVVRAAAEVGAAPAVLPTVRLAACLAAER